jgi:carbamoyltransferase
LLLSAGIPAQRYKDDRELCRRTVDALADGKVVGWFQGRMEFGPRALGSRSILADPRDPAMRDRVNALVKKRERFRPFAPAVLEERAAEHFDLGHSSPFMLETCKVTSRLELPAITHVDRSARVQTVSGGHSPRFELLLEAFEERTGCPMLLNTSFNLKDEPIVCSPADALACFVRANLDLLVLEDFVVVHSDLSPEFLAGVNESYRQIDVARRAPVSHAVYTLV